MLGQIGDLYTLAKRKEQANNSKSVEKILMDEVYPLLPFAPNKEVLNSIQYLSAATYEQSKCKDKTIVFLADTKRLDKVVVDVLLDEEIEIPITPPSKENTKILRKLINPLPPDCCFIFGKKESDDTYYAIGSTQEKNLCNELYYKCTIIDQMNWKLSLHSGNDEIGLFSCEFSSFKEYPNKCKEEKVKDNEQQEKDELKKEMEEKGVDEVFKDTIEQIHSFVFQYLKSLTNEKCGTSFAIFKANGKRKDGKARTEAKRLAGNKPARGYLLKDFSPLTLDVLKQIINIDGGIIVDTNNVCYAYGCIFDGKVKRGFCGERASGARHNSMKMYVENQRKGTCVGIVFSEDGGYKIYSN